MTLTSDLRWKALWSSLKSCNRAFDPDDVVSQVDHLVYDEAYQWFSGLKEAFVIFLDRGYQLRYAL